ncbi:uncharacterized protein VTP21DRAFT_3458 [Calcarisporiella thermophila]|uniref:uncharacterized protein n=1 Tax=Calcarisporiella thermophila TaxID=911321 RepID=UPI003742690E
MGRRKIRIEKLKDERNRQASALFSGPYILEYFNCFYSIGHLLKAQDRPSEESVRAQIGLIIFGPNDKVVQYASTNVDKVLYRYTEYKGAVESRTNADFEDIGVDKDGEKDDELDDEEGSIYASNNVSKNLTPSPQPPVALPTLPTQSALKPHHYTQNTPSDYNIQSSRNYSPSFSAPATTGEATIFPHPLNDHSNSTYQFTAPQPPFKRPRLRLTIPNDSNPVLDEAVKISNEDVHINLTETPILIPRPSASASTNSTSTSTSATTSSMATPRTTVAPSTTGMESSSYSQFAQDISSPSGFYSEFYQNNELPSPFNLLNTPTTANVVGAYHWPLPSSRVAAGIHQPSPLSKEASS